MASFAAFIRRFLPLALVACMGVAGLLALARPWLGPAFPDAYAGWAAPLLGVVAPAAMAPPDLASIRTGEAQNAAAAAFAEALPQRAAMVRGFNDLLWRSTGASYMSQKALVTGRGNVLFVLHYIQLYCGHIEHPPAAAIEGMATRLRRVQDWLDARGTPFAYLLAPSKAAFTRDSFGHLLSCAPDGDEPAYATAIAILKKAGVRVVAGREVLRASTLPGPFYPHLGIHWNEVGAAEMTRALVETLRGAGAALPPFQFSSALQPSERGYDVDLLNLLNLAHVPASPPAPEVAPVPSTEAVRPSLATVSDSYMTGPLELLQRARFMRHIDAFNYLILQRRTFDPVLTPYPIDQNSPNAFAPLLSADIIVLQEVDFRIGGPFVLYFLKLMEHAMAHDGALLSPSEAAR